MKPVRVWFKKTGLAIYISHLDMNRCLSRAVIRAKIPLWYTEGFNPKPYLNFLCPLALGQEGLCEPLDIRIEGESSFEEIRQSLSSVMPDGIEIIDVKEPVMKTAQITSAKYTVNLGFDDSQHAADYCKKSLSLVSSGELLAEKRSKRGTKTVNLCEMINSFEASCQDNRVFVTAVLPTGSALNLNPDLLLDTLIEKTESNPCSRYVSRVCLYNEKGELFV